MKKLTQYLVKIFFLGNEIYKRGKMKSIIFFLAIILIFHPLAFANTDAGTKSFTFLKIPIGARSSAMSNATYGHSGDEYAPFSNPAGLAKLKNKRFSFTYLNYLVGYNGGSASFTFPLNNNSALAIFSKFIGVDGIDKTDINIDTGELIDLDSTFGSYDLLLGLSYGTYVSDILDFGLNVKFLSETIEDYSSQAVAADVSIIHQTPNPKLKIGLAAKNIGTQINKFDKEEEQLPIQFIAGFSYIIPEGLFNVDLVKSLNQDIYANIGIEKAVHNNLILRAGYRSNAADWQVGSNLDFISGISAGFGFEWKNINFDYALNSYGELGFVHQISLGRNL